MMNDGGRGRFEAYECSIGRMIQGHILWDGQIYRIVEVQDRWIDWQACEADTLERAYGKACELLEVHIPCHESSEDGHDCIVDVSKELRRLQNERTRNS